MKLNKLIINRLPGISSGFELKTKATVSVIIGPNGSGKSSLTRAVRHLLWTEGSPGSPFSVEAFFTWDGTQWKAVREEGMPTRWLREGQLADAPDLPGDHVARCYEMGVLDLVLPAGGEVEQQLAEVINREMSGGVNLAQVADGIFSFGARTASQKNLDLQKITKELGSLTRHQKQLFEQERELVDMQKTLERSNSSAAVHGLLKKLQELREKTIDLEAVRFQINEFDTGQDKIRPDDNDTLATLTRLRRNKDRQVQTADTELRIRTEQLQTLELPEQLTDCSLLTRQVNEAANLHQNIQKLQEDFARQEGVIQQTLLDLDPDADGDAAGPTPGKDVYSRLSLAFSRTAEHRAFTEGLETLLALPELQTPEAEPDTGASVEKLKTWLETNQNGNSTLPVSGLAAALVSVASGWMLFSSNESTMGLGVMALGAAVAGYCIFQWLKIQSRNKHNTRLGSEIAEHCRAAGISLDLPLNPSQVQKLIQDETRVEALSQSRQTLRDYLSGQHLRQEQKREKYQDHLDELRQQHGLAMNRDMPDLINLLNIIPRFRAAQDEAAATAGAINENQKKLGVLLDIIGTSFADLGFPPPSTVIDAEHLLEKLDHRLKDRQKFQDEQKRYREELTQQKLDLDETESSLKGFWNRLGVPPQADDQLVRELVDHLSTYQETLTQETQLQHLVTTLDTDFRSQPDLLNPDEAEKLTEEQLDQRLEKLLTDTQGLEELIAEISQIKFQVNQARQSNQMAETQALQKAAQTTLLETRQQERESTLGRFLLEDVQQTYHHASRPKVLALASDNFRDFTQGLYELRVVSGPGHHGHFAAFDLEKQENLGLSELSDGTRAQLLLAVRLAFIAQNEEAAAPPIFLDESLTSSDPQRFAAIADKLAGWAESQQRQVFYLSSNPNDASAWEVALKKAGLPQPAILDLATARKMKPGQPLSYDFQAPGAPPAPENLTAAEYARLLVVPNLAPWKQSTETHMWYLLQDDLPQLHRLLMASAPTLGRLLARKNDIQVLGKMSSQKLANLEARGHCLSAFFRYWRIGRNRPVTAETLISSEAIGQTFIEKCRDLLEDVNGDAAELIKGLRGKKVKRFATKKIDELERYFLIENFLDPHDRLDEEDLLSSVLSVMEPEIKEGKLEIGEARTLVLSWWGLLRA